MRTITYVSVGDKRVAITEEMLRRINDTTVLEVEFQEWEVCFAAKSCIEWWSDGLSDDPFDKWWRSQHSDWLFLNIPFGKWSGNDLYVIPLSYIEQMADMNLRGITRFAVEGIMTDSVFRKYLISGMKSVSPKECLIRLYQLMVSIQNEYMSVVWERE